MQISPLQKPESLQIIDFNHVLRALKNPEHSLRSPVLVQYIQNRIGIKASRSIPSNVYKDNFSYPLKVLLLGGHRGLWLIMGGPYGTTDLVGALYDMR